MIRKFKIFVYFYVLAALVSACGAVRSGLTSKVTNASTTSNEEAQSALYETVNSLPQFTRTEDGHFGLYWSLWRGVSRWETSEIARLGSASLMSERDISWTTESCDEGTPSVASGNEVFWYLDELKMGSDGLVIPIAEAERPGFRYLNMITWTSLHVKATGPYVKPPRKSGEKRSDYEARAAIAFNSWKEGTVIAGLRGTIEVAAVHKFISVVPDTISGQFVSFLDYAYGQDPQLHELFLPYTADRWPIYHDERGHKPHSMTTPEIWTRSVQMEAGINAPTKFKAKFEWNACNGPVTLKMYAPQGSLGIPKPGPTRPGRTEQGSDPFEIIRISE